MNTAPEKIEPVRENQFVSLLFNIVIPTLILVKMSGPERLGPANGLIVALAFPIFYGLFDFAKRRKFNFISFLGFISVLMTGGIGLLEIGGIWFAVKEAAIPAMIGAAIFVSQKMGKPLLRTLFFNDQLINIAAVQQALQSANAEQEFEELMVTATYLIGLSFFLSAIVNFALATVIVDGPPGTTVFNEQVGYMNAVSFPVIMVSSTSLMMYALWRLLKGLRRLTGMEWEQILRQK